MNKIFSNPESVAPPAGTYSQAVRVEVGGAVMIFVSGQVADDRDGNLVGENDITRQTECAYENIKAILEANGASLGDVVKANVFVTDISLRSEVAEVRKRYFTENPPASTFVEVSKLAKEGWLIEIDVIAVVQK